MHSISLIVGLFLCFGVWLDIFQTIVLPRRPTGRLRLTRLFYNITWIPWSWGTRRIRRERTREQMYSIYGPLSLLMLLAVWAVLLVLAFGMIYFAMGTPFTDSMVPRRSGLGHEIFTDLYVSGTTLFTLGLGDVVPDIPIARTITIFEAGVGLGLVALVVGYLPVLYAAFSRREVPVALLDARAGSPPTAAELLSRHGFDGGETALIELLAEWERWSAELLESHISYPILCYYRSQHDNQSWLSALVTVLDACAMLIATGRGNAVRQAQLTFVIARHALVDIGHVFHLEKLVERKRDEGFDRLPPAEFGRLCNALEKTEIGLCGDGDAAQRLYELRTMYEPHAAAIAYYLGFSLPRWLAEPRAKDPWRNVERLRADYRNASSVLHISTQATAVLLDEKDRDH